MAKLTGPLVSFGASGQVGKTLVASKWKGRPYMRQYVIPSNPNTTGQQATRSVFTWGNQVWKTAPPDFQAPWNSYAEGQVMTGRNAFLKFAVADLRSQVDLSAMTFSPGAKGGLAAAGLTLTPGVGEIDVLLTAPTLPTGWAITQAVAAAIEDQDPSTGILYTVTAGSDAADPYDFTLTGLNTNLYYVGAWFEFTKADGTTAYGPSLTDSATPT